MHLTQKLRLRQPDNDDYYNIADHNHNMNILDDAVTSAAVQSIRVMTQSEFDALSAKSTSVLYLVTSSGAVKAYLGSTPVVEPVIELTQAAYDALDPPDANTLYAIPEVE